MNILYMSRGSRVSVRDRALSPDPYWKYSEFAVWIWGQVRLPAS